MKEYKVSSTYIMKSPVPNAPSGTVLTSLELRAPIGTHRELTNKIHNYIRKAMTSSLELFKSIGSEKIDELAKQADTEASGDAYYNLLLASDYYVDFCRTFDALIFKQRLTINETESVLIEAYYNSFLDCDRIGLMKQYLNDFFTQ